MARFLCKSDAATHVISGSGQAGRGKVIRVITGGVTAFFSFGTDGKSLLETNRGAAGAGIPANGLPMTSLDPPLILPEFSDDCWALAAAQFEVEVLDFAARPPAARSSAAGRVLAARGVCA